MDGLQERGLYGRPRGARRRVSGAVDTNPTADEINAWLDTIDVDPADARDATHFRRIVAAREAAEAAQDEQRAAVAAARAAGDSWAMIGCFAS